MGMKVGIGESNVFCFRNFYTFIPGIIGALVRGYIDDMNILLPTKLLDQLSCTIIYDNNLKALKPLHHYGMDGLFKSRQIIVYRNNNRNYILVIHMSTT